LAVLTVELIELALDTHRGRLVASVENPKNSLLWHMSCFVRLAARLGMRFTAFQVCMAGGERDKWSGLLHNSARIHEVFAPLICDHCHIHRPWGLAKRPEGGWATAEEAEYPDRLCELLVDAVVDDLVAHGLARPSVQQKDEGDADPGDGSPASPAIHDGVVNSDAAMDRLERAVRRHVFVGSKTRTNITSAPRDDKGFLMEPVLSDVVRSGELFEAAKQMLPNFPFSMITVNKDLVCEPHRDRNGGPSAIVFLGRGDGRCPEL